MALFFCYGSKESIKNLNGTISAGSQSYVLRFAIILSGIDLSTKNRKQIRRLNIGSEILYFQYLNCLQTLLFCKSIIPEEIKSAGPRPHYGSVKS